MTNDSRAIGEVFVAKNGEICYDGGDEENLSSAPVELHRRQTNMREKRGGGSTSPPLTKPVELNDAMVEIVNESGLAVIVLPAQLMPRLPGVLFISEDGLPETLSAVLGILDKLKPAPS